MYNRILQHQCNEVLKREMCTNSSSSFSSSTLSPSNPISFPTANVSSNTINFNWILLICGAIVVSTLLFVAAYCLYKRYKHQRRGVYFLFCFVSTLAICVCSFHTLFFSTHAVIRLEDENLEDLNDDDDEDSDKEELLHIPTAK